MGCALICQAPHCIVQLPNARLEVEDANMKHGLTQMIARFYERRKAWLYTELIYAFFVVATGILGFFILDSPAQNPSPQLAAWLIVPTGLSLLFILMVMFGARMSRRYFAYGSDMDVQLAKQRGISSRVTWSRNGAILEDYRLEFNKLGHEGKERVGYPNIVPSEGAEVESVLYDTTDSDGQRVDEYNGYPVYYQKKEVVVKLQDTGRNVRAFAYVASPAKTKEELAPSKTQIQRMLTAQTLLSNEYVNNLNARLLLGRESR
jgi:gamma-glutamylcyclotransferase (GGCT)/AIG2-like uncharacterized protein YtfP